MSVNTNKYLVKKKKKSVVWRAKQRGVRLEPERVENKHLESLQILLQYRTIYHWEKRLLFNFCD